MGERNGATVTTLCQASMGNFTGAAGKLTLGSVAGVGLGVDASSLDACSKNEMGEWEAWRADLHVQHGVSKSYCTKTAKKNRQT